MLREEYPFPHTSDIVEVASRGASANADEIIEKKRGRKEGVRPLQLMDLPPEIRNRIFEYAVSSYSVCSYARTTTDLQGLWCIGELYRYAAVQPAITRASRQLRKETLEMFYDANHFVVELIGWNSWKLTNIGDHRVSQWLEAIRPQNATAIKMITIRYCPDTLQKLGTSIDRVMAETSFRFVAAFAKLEVE
ncbi:hypothetical protein LTR10_015863 [Elasticomyces elasticus]|nr:hypothetical protein LTR10_015863 [Elasticomyces elasticus]KAK4974681.1 hypothetical protein LTR42_005327 [Elasticomyces elasticus]